jgi:hypothetical protein
MLHESRIARRMTKKRRAEIAESHAIEWTRADTSALAKFDPSTKVCTMNCGRHVDDPRSPKECKFLCDDCIEA